MDNDVTAQDLAVKIFADGADVARMKALARNPLVKGFTTNPTLMRQAGVPDYEAFAREAAAAVHDLPISFEVFADDFGDMERQALKIAGLGDNLNVKIPVTNTSGDSAVPLLRRLAARGVKLNVTALMTVDQVRQVGEALAGAPSGYVSVFAGRVADSGRDPVPLMKEALRALSPWPRIELIWASPRQVFDIVQADRIGCHIITVTYDLLDKVPLLGKDLDAFSLETVKMFHGDAGSAGYSL